MSAALSLVGLLFFAATGLTLNNAALIEASPHTTTRTANIPPELLTQLRSGEGLQKKRALPQAIEAWLDHALDIRINRRPAEFSVDEVYLSLPEPGGDAWLSIDIGSGGLEYERTSRGWVSFFNDLHKGRQTGVVWSWFIDVFAIGCLVFALSGLFLIKIHAGNRLASWPLVGLGLIAPFILILLFIH